MGEEGTLAMHATLKQSTLVPVVPPAAPPCPPETGPSPTPASLPGIPPLPIEPPLPPVDTVMLLPHPTAVATTMRPKPASRRRSLKTSRTFKANGISGDLARSLRKECIARKMCQRFLSRRQEVEPL